MSIFSLSFLNPHWLSGRSPDCSRCSFSRLSRTLARTFPATDNKEMPRWLSHNWGFPFRLNRWIIDASLNSWGMSSFLHIMWNYSDWSSSSFVHLSRYCIWSWSLARWQYCFHCFSDGCELCIRLHSTYGSLLIASSLIDDGRLRILSKCSTHLFKIASLSQKTSSICTEKRGGSWAIGTINCLAILSSGVDARKKSGVKQE